MYGTAFVGILVGSFCRIVLPYLQKDVPFDINYIDTMILAIITSMLVASFMISSFQIPENPSSSAAIFGTALLQGWGATDIFNKFGIDWRKSK